MPQTRLAVIATKIVKLVVSHIIFMPHARNIRLQHVPKAPMSMSWNDASRGTLRSFIKCLFQDMPTKFHWNRFISDKRRANDLNCHGIIQLFDHPILCMMFKLLNAFNVAIVVLHGLSNCRYSCSQCLQLFQRVGSVDDGYWLTDSPVFITLFLAYLCTCQFFEPTPSGKTRGHLCKIFKHVRSSSSMARS